MIYSEDAPFAVFVEVEVICAEVALALVLVVQFIGVDRWGAVGFVPVALFRRFVEFAQVAEVDESRDLFGGLVPAAEDRPGTANVVVPVEVDRIIQLNRKRKSCFSSDFALTDLDFDKALSIIPDLILSMEQERSGGNTEIAITSGVHSEFKRLVQLRCAGEKYNIPERASYPFFEKFFAENKENDPGNTLFAILA